MVYPFQALQMFNIGLTYNEIAIIMGAVQAISFVAAPITGCYLLTASLHSNLWRL